MVMPTAGLMPTISKPESNPDSDEVLSQNSRPNRVLVLERDDVLRDAIIGALGVAVSALGARTGHDALRMLDEFSPTIVLLNVQINDMDGVELLKRVRERLPDSKVIVTSDSGDYGLIRQVTALGVGDFLEKPYGIEDLFHSLTNSVRGVTTQLDDRKLAARYHQKCRLRRQALLAAS